MNLFKQDNGNLMFLSANNAEEERSARAAGWLTLEELFPTEVKKQVREIPKRK